MGLATAPGATVYNRQLLRCILFNSYNWLKHASNILKTGPNGLIFLLCFLLYLTILIAYKKLSKKSLFILINSFMILVFIFIVLACMYDYYKLKTLKEEKIEIYNYFEEKLQTVQKNLQKQTTRNYSLENKLNKSNNWINISGFVFGKIISQKKNPIADVKIIAEGGSQAYSNSNGEFIIDCQIGQNIFVEKNGYERYSFIVTEKLINQNKSIILIGGEP